MLHIDQSVLRALVSAWLVTENPKRIKRVRHAVRNRLQIVRTLPSTNTADAETLEKLVDLLTAAEAQARICRDGRRAA